jgi:polysaccharide deacetylase 2 family uncharacterized protein YibQ
MSRFRQNIRSTSKVENRLKRVWLPLAFCSLLILVIFVLYAYLENRTPQETIPSRISDTPSVDEMRLVLNEVLNRYGLSSDIKKRTGTKKEEYTVLVPPELSIHSLQYEIQQGLRSISADVLSGKGDPLSGKISLQAGVGDSCFFKIHLIRARRDERIKGKIAIIIDDFGNRWDAFVRSFLDLNVDLTVSVIPGLEMSSRVAREMSERGYEVILHLPMEPISGKYKDDGYIILSNMDRKSIRKVVKQSLISVPDAVGVNNHMGSKITSGKEVITMVLEEVQAHGLYFVDSRTIGSTVAYDVARQLGISCGKRDVFLDTDRDPEAVRKSIWELVRKAKANGFSIGIGHCRRTTLNVLKEEIPRIQAEGYRFVHVSEVLR